MSCDQRALSKIQMASSEHINFLAESRLLFIEKKRFSPSNLHAWHRSTNPMQQLTANCALLVMMLNYCTSGSFAWASVLHIRWTLKEIQARLSNPTLIIIINIIINYFLQSAIYNNRSIALYN